jgi:hypothetical protein
MLSPPKSPMQQQVIDASTLASKTVEYRRKEVIDGDVVRTYESRRRRHYAASVDLAAGPSQATPMTSAAREQALQAALELPSSVIIVKGLRRMLNSDEPLFNDLKSEQRLQLQREYLIDVGVAEPICDTALRSKIMFPPSPPATPKVKPSCPVKVDDADRQRFCECCRVNCV